MIPVPGFFSARPRAIADIVRALFAYGEQGVWYDPSDFATMYQDAAGTTPVTAVGQPVGRLLDKSGRGNHASQATAASRPVLQQDESGRYYLAFDGVDDWLSVGSSTDRFKFLHDNTGSTVHIGAAMSGAAVYHSLVSTSNLGQATVIGWSFSQDDRTTGQVISTMVNGSATAFLNQTAASAVSSSRRTYTVQNGSGLHVIRRGGAEVSGTATETGSASASSSTYGLTIGRSGGGLLPFHGRLYSLIIRGALSNESQTSKTERYVNLKTGAY